MRRSVMRLFLTFICLLLMIPAGICAQRMSPWAERTFRRSNELNLLEAGGLHQDAQRPITRLQFVSLVVTLAERATGEPLAAGSAVFLDTTNVMAQKAAAAGITAGTGEGMFSPDLPITRQEMSVMLLKAVSLVAGDAVKPPADLNAYIDGDQVAPWARQAVGSMVSSGLMSGISTTELAPCANTTTEQAVMMVYKAYGLITADKLSPWTAEFLAQRRQAEEDFQRQYSGAADFVDQRIDRFELLEVYGKSLGYSETYLVFCMEFSLKSQRPELLFLPADMSVDAQGWMSTGLSSYLVFRQEDNELSYLKPFLCAFDPEGNQQMFRQAFDAAVLRA